MSFLVQIEIKTLYDSKINAAEDPADSNKPQAGVKKNGANTGRNVSLTDS